MKKFVGILLLICLVFVGCPVDTQDDNPANPVIPDPVKPVNPVKPTDPVDPAFWFIEIYGKLIERIGEKSSDSCSDITDSSGVDNMGQIVNTQYVCSAINAKWGSSYTPVSGTATQAANCEYLLKMIDKANNNKTSFGTSNYATNQAVDTTTVDNAVNALWVPGEKFVAVSGTNKAAYSTDGITWTETTIPSSVNWYNVTYGDGKFVVVSNTNIAAYSTDGITWTETTMPYSASWSSVTYGGY